MRLDESERSEGACKVVDFAGCDRLKIIARVHRDGVVVVAFCAAHAERKRLRYEIVSADRQVNANAEFEPLSIDTGRL